MSASFPFQVCFLERNPSFHNYIIWFQHWGSKLQHQGIPSDWDHFLRLGTPTSGFMWKTYCLISFPETGGTLKSAGWNKMTSDESTAGQHVLSQRSSTLLSLVPSQEDFSGIKFTVREGKKVFLFFSSHAYINILVFGWLSLSWWVFHLDANS